MEKNKTNIVKILDYVFYMRSDTPCRGDWYGICPVDDCRKCKENKDIKWKKKK